MSESMTITWHWNE